MKITRFQFVSAFTISMVLMLLYSPLTPASTISGHVLDHNANPVSDVTVELREFNNDVTDLSNTDEDGAFSISVNDFPVKLNLHQKNNSPYAISMINIEGMIYYPNKHPNFANGFVFSVADGVDIEDVQIHVRKRTLIKGRVLNPDGTPLRNVNVRLDLSGQTTNSTSSTIRGMLIQLDDDGFFEKYVEGPGYFTFLVKYQKKIARTDEIYITGKPEEDRLILMLGGKTTTNLNKEVKVLPPQLNTKQKERMQMHPLTDLSSEQKSSFSGRVMDTHGNKVSEIQIGLKPMQFIHGIFVPEIYRIGKPDDSQTTQTDAHIRSGNRDNRLPPRNILYSKLFSSSAFSFNEIEFGPLQLFIQRDDKIIDSSKISNTAKLETKYEILSVKIGNLVFDNFSHQLLSPFNNLKFALKPGTRIDNVEITIKQRLRINGKIVNTDGTPLKNRSIKLRIKEPKGEIVRLGDADGYTSSANIRTDDYGNFTIFVENSGDYYLHVKYIVLTAEAGPITIKDKAQENDLILKLNGKLLFPDSPPEDITAADEEQIPEVWVVNPINGHSYKLIECEDWNDAHLQAIQNGSHLVSINDEAEHKWLSEIYGSGFFWIGLNDLEKEGEWVWDGGEPVTYKQWETNVQFPDENLTDADKDYVIMNLNGKWEAAGQQSTLWIMTRQAILENDGLLSTIQPQSESQNQ
ncbi:hypothetical protein JT359_20585 [Candidatus Poribacteria bacterium]|nr:hypothetical protein [Candidatus Poribacteria bacterium]